MSWRRWLVCLAVLLAGCSAPPTVGHREGDQAGSGGEATGRRLVVWMLSDIQPSTPAKRVQFERAVDDIGAQAENIDFAVIAGDLLKSRSRDEDFAWFLTTRDRARVPVWYEIAGNHDVRSGKIFHKHFPRPDHYAVIIGNLLLLLMSDKSPSSQTEISDEVFKWWQEMVVHHQDCIIITVTHAPLSGSGLLGSAFASRTIVGSERFERVLREQRVAIWASGHIHLPEGLPGTTSRREDLGGTFFINVSAIEEDFLKDSQSRLFSFVDGSDKALIRSRNHSKGRLEDQGLVVPLGKAFAWQGEGPQEIE